MDFRKGSDGDGMKEISYDELKEAARPLMELLRKKGNMEMSALVTDETVVIMESLVGTSIEYND